MLLRSIGVAFKNDTYAIQQAKQKVKEEFVKHKDIRDKDELKLLLENAFELDELLRFNIVQGQRTQSGNYGNLAL
jgi:hypothetical protein